MIQRIPAHGVVDMPDEVEIKEIFPGLAPQRPRFDLRQIDIAQRERAQRPEQRTRQVPRSENQCGLESPRGLRLGFRRSDTRRAFGRPFEKEKPREVFAIVLNRFSENPAAIDLRRAGRRDGARRQ